MPSQYIYISYLKSIGYILYVLEKRLVFDNSVDILKVKKWRSAKQ